MRYAALITAAVLLPWPFPAAAAALNVTLPAGLVLARSTEVRESREGTPDSVRSSHDELRVGLGDRQVLIAAPEQVQILDFGNGTVRFFDPSQRAVFSGSLCAVAAFAEMEIQNRVAMNRMLAVVGRDTAGPSLLDQEATLRVEAAGATRKGVGRVTERHDGAALVIALDGRAHVVCVWSDTTLDAPARAAFEKFLLYGLQLHPEARARLVAEGRLPRTLTVRNRDLGSSSVTQLELEAVGPADPALGAIPADFRRARFSEGHDDSLTALLERAPGPCARAADSLEREAQGFMASAAARGQVLDAFLASVEYALMTGRAPDALWTEDLKRQAQRDERLREYRRAASSAIGKSPDQARKAVAKLEAIDRGGLEKGYIIDTEIGNAHQAAGQGVQGRRHLETALWANPCLAGAWLDIGSGFLNDYQTYVAWECFDVARRILPAGSPSFSRVEALERDLRARHPEFF